MNTLITGGSGSGKSYFAESLVVLQATPRIYIATMQPFGADAQARIERHRAQRAHKGFYTIERYDNYHNLSLKDEVSKSQKTLGTKPFEGDTQSSVVLLECLGNLVANVMFGDKSPVVQKNLPEVVTYCYESVLHLMEQCSDLVIVTNEVGSDGYLYDELTQDYQWVLGALNCKLAYACDRAYEVCASQPLRLR